MRESIIHCPLCCGNVTRREREHVLHGPYTLKTSLGSFLGVADAVQDGLNSMACDTITNLVRKAKMNMVFPLSF